MPGQLWEIVGGGETGGILVKDGKAFDSAKLKERLSTGAIVEEIVLEGERLNFKRLTGTGPEVGWISIKLPNKDLAVKTDNDPREGEADDVEQIEPNRETSQEVKDMIKARCEKELAKPPYTWQWIDQNLVMNNAGRKAKGAIYGLEFPWNEETLKEFGPAWLTKAFHTAGTMPQDNKVTKVILEKKIKVTTGNNGGKFLFEVSYAKPSADLHTKLFAKVPFPLEGKTKMDRISSSVNKQPAELYEINAYRYLEATLPMKTPRFYFGDISNETSNWIIITERIAFHDFNGVNFGPPGPTPDPLAPYEIEGPYDKCVDKGNLRGKAEEYYLLVTRVGAQMAGMAKTGAFGSEDLLKASFRASPDSNNPMMWGMNPGASTGKPNKQLKMMLDGAVTFCTETAKVLFPDFLSDSKCLQKFRSTMMISNAYSAELNYWMHMNPDYVSLGHMNLNVDNAYFWRDENGKLDCGVFDWGGMGTSSYGGKLWWWYYCMDYEVFKNFLSNLLECFEKEYKASGGGQSLNTEQLYKMVIVAAVQQMDGLVSAVPQIYKMCSKKEFATIKDRYDPRIALNIDDKSTIRLYLHCMNSIFRIIEEMKGDQLVKDFIDEVYQDKFKQSPKSDAIVFEG